MATVSRDADAVTARLVREHGLVDAENIAKQRARRAVSNRDRRFWEGVADGLDYELRQTSEWFPPAGSNPGRKRTKLYPDRYGYLVAGRTRPHAWRQRQPSMSRRDATAEAMENIRRMRQRGEDVAFDFYLLPKDKRGFKVRPPKGRTAWNSRRRRGGRNPDGGGGWQKSIAFAYTTGLKHGKRGVPRKPPNDFRAAYAQGYSHGAKTYRSKYAYAGRAGGKKRRFNTKRRRRGGARIPRDAKGRFKKVKRGGRGRGRRRRAGARRRR